MNEKQKQKFIEAGKIAVEVKKYAREIIKPGMLLLEIAEKIESKIIELGGKPAFPTNLAINDEAAHVTPAYNSEDKSHGLLKIDLGVHIQGVVADTALSIDLENSNENKKIIEAAEEALSKAIEKIKSNPKHITLSQIGKIIEDTINSKNLTPIINLSGHSIEEYNLHAGTSIPNTDTGSNKTLASGVYAIEPFATNGNGKVYDGKPSGIYLLQTPKNVRSPLARDVLDYIIEEYDTLPFCQRWIIKKFGTRGLIALNELEKNKIIHHYEQLIESGHGKVAQAEHTILIDGDEVTVTTE